MKPRVIFAGIPFVAMACVWLDWLAREQHPLIPLAFITLFIVGLLLGTGAPMSGVCPHCVTDIPPSVSTCPHCGKGLDPPSLMNLSESERNQGMFPGGSWHVDGPVVPYPDRRKKGPWKRLKAKATYAVVGIMWWMHRPKKRDG